jgi:hypothetical protein
MYDDKVHLQAQTLYDTASINLEGGGSGLAHIKTYGYC